MANDLDEICRRSKITEYLSGAGVELKTSGSRIKCSCPLPDHNDKTPSFYISELDNGVQLFKCFGCGKGGNIFTLISLMEKQSVGSIVKKLAGSTGVKLDGASSHSSFTPEPTEDEIEMSFCIEDDQAIILSSYVLGFLKAQGGSEDAVQKVSKIYDYLDDLIERGDKDALHKATKKLKQILVTYR